MIPSPFIVGTGRCGTTLLRLMLDAHTQLAIPPETHFIPSLVRSRRRTLRPRRAFLKAVTGAPFWLDNHLDESELKRRVEALRPFNLSEALRLFYKLYAESRGKTRWGDKTPFYVRHMANIQKVLPEARFIHLIRDGRDVALSFKDLWFGPDSVEEAALRWASWIKETRQQAHNLTGYLEVRYEDLILETEATLKRVCDFTGLDWEPQMLDYHLTAEERLGEMVQPLHVGAGQVIQAQARKSIHVLTGQPPMRDRIKVWKTEMRPSDQARFERIAGHLLRELGYDT
jgi:hypothetical protein